MDKHYSRSAIILILSCFYLNVFAQPAGKLLLKPDLIAVLQHTPTLQPRIEYKLTTKTSLQATGGFCYGTFYTIYQNNNSPEYDAVNLKGFSAKLEYRYYLQDTENALQGIYVAPETGYKYVTYQQGRFFEITTLNNTVYEKMLEYNVKKNTYLYHIKIGYQEKITDRLYVDVFGGIGRRIIVLKNNIQVPEDAVSMKLSPSWERLYWGHKGTHTRFSITGSVLLGFML